MLKLKVTVLGTIQVEKLRPGHVCHLGPEEWLVRSYPESFAQLRQDNAFPTQHTTHYLLAYNLCIYLNLFTHGSKFKG